MGRMGETCGAVTGAFMVIGLKHGKTREDDDEARERTYALVQEFAERFRARNKSIICRELLGHDLGTPEGMQAVTEKKLFQTFCPGLIRHASEMLDEMLG